MSTVYFTTINYSNTGRASHYFDNSVSAETTMLAQNERAGKLGIKAKYSVAGTDSKNVPATEKVRT
ncbi:MAG: hypothetical protein GY951_18430 [Psychromonas sp.]|nr:hypothetical protein [Psychromonas sp.]